MEPFWPRRRNLHRGGVCGVWSVEEPARAQVREWECRMCYVYKRFGQEMHSGTFLLGKKCSGLRGILKAVAVSREVWGPRSTISHRGGGAGRSTSAVSARFSTKGGGWRSTHTLRIDDSPLRSRAELPTPLSPHPDTAKAGRGGGPEPCRGLGGGGSEHPHRVGTRATRPDGASGERERAGGGGVRTPGRAGSPRPHGRCPPSRARSGNM